MPDSPSLTSVRNPFPGDKALGDAVLRIRNLDHHYGEGELRRQVLFDNNLEVSRGEIVVMTGPSGSGKTTLLTLIGALRSVQQGSLEVLGDQLRGAALSDLVRTRRKLGFIFQAHNLFQSLTAFQNVRMAAELFGFSAEECNRRITELLTLLGLEQRMHYKPGALSGGQKQRVAIARALVHRPLLILADEPTAALDEKASRNVVLLLQRLTREDRSTIILVTHDNRILDVADRIVNMVDGQIKSNVVVKVTAEICEFLRTVSIFQGMTPGNVAQVADKVKWERHSPGTAIVVQGDEGDKFYVIRRGAVDVKRTVDSQTRHVVSLGPGEYFGETALLTGAPRNATVIASQDTEVYALSNEDFQRVLKGSASFEEELRKALFQRQ